jgi:type VI secretion system protein ImpC
VADPKKQPAPASQTSVQTAGAQVEGPSLADVITATPNAEPDRAKGFLDSLVKTAGSKGVVIDRTVKRTLLKLVTMIDAELSEQLGEIMHAPEFQKLEGTWRGFHHLVHNSETGPDLTIRVLNIRKRELQKDLEDANDFDQSALYRKIYEGEFGTPGGLPFGALIGDFDFSQSSDDVSLLRKISSVAAAAFCPFIANASPKLFGGDADFEKPLSKIPDLKTWFAGQDFIKWREFRKTPDARFVSLVMPRVMAREPYDPENNAIEEFEFREVPSGRAVPHKDYCWMNAAWHYGTVLTRAFAESGWCTTIRGAESGGKIDNLPVHLVSDEDGDQNIKCPTEVPITDRREKELSDCGFLPISHYKESGTAVFFGGQTVQQPTKYDTDDATSNAAISARLPYIMAVSRVAHFLKVMARDWTGSAYGKQKLQERMQRWIAKYVLDDPDGTPEMKAKHPLAEATVTVEEVPGSPGSYNAVAHLRPWLQLEELTTSMRLVAKLPQPTGK